MSKNQIIPNLISMFAIYNTW